VREALDAAGADDPAQLGVVEHAAGGVDLGVEEATAHADDAAGMAGIDDHVHVGRRQLRDHLVEQPVLGERAVGEGEERLAARRQRAVAAEHDVDDRVVAPRALGRDPRGQPGHGPAQVVAGRRPRRRGDARVAALGGGVDDGEELALPHPRQELVEADRVVVGVAQRAQPLAGGALGHRVVADDDRVAVAVGAGVAAERAQDRGGDQPCLHSITSARTTTAVSGPALAAVAALPGWKRARMAARSRAARENTP
jgi:hypothetical protein